VCGFVVQPVIKFVKIVANCQALLLYLRIGSFCRIWASRCELYGLEVAVIIWLEQNTTQSIVTCIYLEYDWLVEVIENKNRRTGYDMPCLVKCILLCG